MKKTILLLILIGLLSIQIHAQNSDSDNRERIENLKGEWTIDLRPEPSAEGYFQSFSVNVINGNTFEGTFYGSEIVQGFINSNWDKIYFAFSTSDGSNDYFHSGYLFEGKLNGISYCPGRKFTAPWFGIRN